MAAPDRLMPRAPSSGTTSEPSHRPRPTRRSNGRSSPRCRTERL